MFHLIFIFYFITAITLFCFTGDSVRHTLLCVYACVNLITPLPLFYRPLHYKCADGMNYTVRPDLISTILSGESGLYWFIQNPFRTIGGAVKEGCVNFNPITDVFSCVSSWTHGLILLCLEFWETLSAETVFDEFNDSGYYLIKMLREHSERASPVRLV